MARVFFVWELGKGFGHLAPYVDLVARLQDEGHEIVFAARDVVNADRIFGSRGLEILQSPLMLHKVDNAFKVQYNFALLLHNLGFGAPDLLVGVIKSWRRLFDRVQPDLAIFDHSPTALVAVRDYPCKKIISGSGFLIPPDAVPLPMTRYWQRYDQERLAAEEDRTLRCLNQALRTVGIPEYASMSEIYRADDLFLLGFEEMDHYPQRRGGRYLGMFTPPGHGVAPQWPEGFERRVFAYLHPYKTLGALLTLLRQARFATLAYAPEVPEAGRKKYASRSLVFSPEPVDIAQAARQCDFAITNGTFGTTAAMLLHGTPVLCIPDNLERLMVARRVIGLGAGTGVTQKQTDQLKPALRSMFTDTRYREAARKFSAKYGHLDQRWQTDQMMEIIGRLLGGRRSATPARAPAAAGTASVPSTG